MPQDWDDKIDSAAFRKRLREFLTSTEMQVLKLRAPLTNNKQLTTRQLNCVYGYMRDTQWFPCPRVVAPEDKIKFINKVMRMERITPRLVAIKNVLPTSPVYQKVAHAEQTNRYEDFGILCEIKFKQDLILEHTYAMRRATETAHGKRLLDSINHIFSSLQVMVVKSNPDTSLGEIVNPRDIGLRIRDDVTRNAFMSKNTVLRTMQWKNKMPEKHFFADTLFLTLTGRPTCNGRVIMYTCRWKGTPDDNYKALDPSSTKTEDDIVEINPKLEFRCMLSHGRIKTPVRFRECKHRGCVDRDAYMQYSKSLPANKCWVCPMCGVTSTADGLVIVQPFAELLAKYPDADTLFRNDAGEWTPVAPVESEGAIVIDDIVDADQPHAKRARTSTPDKVKS